MGWSDKAQEADDELSFEEAVESNELETLSPTEIVDEIDGVEDIELLEQAHESDSRKSVCEKYRERIDELEAEEELDEVEDEVPDIDSMGTDDTPEENTVSEPETENEDNSPALDLDRLAPNAMDVSDAADKEHTWKMMIWGGEGMGKTHFAYTMPEPIMLVDTENKAEDIASKFSDKQVKIWQPKSFTEACEAVEQALDVLEQWQAETGDTGTLVIDSMSVMWEWSQYKYIDDYYPNTAPEDANMDLQDWGKIKDYHNETFRKPIEECDFHVCWTEMQKDDVGAKIQEGLEKTPVKPAGETNNKYKVNDIIQLQLDEQGVPTGFQRKSGRNRFKYLGLTRPTFEKHKEITEAIEQVEAEGVDSELELRSEIDVPYELNFTEGNTMEIHE